MSGRMSKIIVILLAVHTVAMVLLVVFMFAIAIQVEGIKSRTGQDLSEIEDSLSEITQGIYGVGSGLDDIDRNLNSLYVTID